MLSAIAWSRGKALLAVGTTKGAAFVYNHQQKRKILIETKHTKTISAIEWLDSERFVLASEDKQVHKHATLPLFCTEWVSDKSQLCNHERVSFYHKH